jgi:hypothetical protein
MPINLLDLRGAVQSYLNTKVTVSLSTFAPDVPATINPNEEFSFSVTATNADAANGGVRLVNVRYHLKVVARSVAKLLVPTNSPLALIGVTARSGPLETDTVLAPGTEVAEMYLFPFNNLGVAVDNKTLDVGEADTLSNLKGIAGGGIGATDIKFDILADVDLNFLFPKNENSAVARQEIVVT